jgi:hypothetical protein
MPEFAIEAILESRINRADRNRAINRSFISNVTIRKIKKEEKKRSAPLKIRLTKNSLVNPGFMSKARINIYAGDVTPGPSGVLALIESMPFSAKVLEKPQNIHASSNGNVGK